MSKRTLLDFAFTAAKKKKKDQEQETETVNKLRYKDGTGDPKGFTTCLEEAGLPKGLISRYRGNRLHIMFHICGQLHQHREFFETYLEKQTHTNQLVTAIKEDFPKLRAKVEIQAIGILGKLLTGPWMVKFYVSSDSEVSHVDGIRIVKEVVQVVEQFSEHPMDTLTTKLDFFGDELKSTDPAVAKLQEKPADDDLFATIIRACLQNVKKVLDKQYSRYFQIDLTEVLEKETQSARLHNMDAEEVMGMFSAAKVHAQNATVPYLSSRIRSQKNKVVKYLDRLEDQKREQLVTFVMKRATENRDFRRKRHVELKAQISKRLAKKVQKKEARERTKLERILRKCDSNSSKFEEEPEFSDVDKDVLQTVYDIMSGRVVGHQIRHIWYDEDTRDRTVARKD